MSSWECQLQVFVHAGCPNIGIFIVPPLVFHNIISVNEQIPRIMFSLQFACCDSFHHLVECVKFLSFRSFSLYFQIIQPPFVCCENETMLVH